MMLQDTTTTTTQVSGRVQQTVQQLKQHVHVGQQYGTGTDPALAPYNVSVGKGMWEQAFRHSGSS